MKTLREAAADAGINTNWLYRAAKKLQTEDYEFAAMYCYYDMCAVSMVGSRHDSNIRCAEDRLGRKMFTPEQLAK